MVDCPASWKGCTFRQTPLAPLGSRVIWISHHTDRWMQGYVNTKKTRNTTWKSSPLRRVLGLPAVVAHASTACLSFQLGPGELLPPFSYLLLPSMQAYYPPAPPRPRPTLEIWLGGYAEDWQIGTANLPHSMIVMSGKIALLVQWSYQWSCITGSLGSSYIQFWESC